ncbi:MAG: HAD family hydrolase [Pirellulaceae bacterium]
MRTSICSILRKHSHPRKPRPTGWQPVWARLSGIKAVLFDVYGTLFVSSAHSMQLTDQTAAAGAFCAALAAVGRDCPSAGAVGVERLAAIIRAAHEAAHCRGIDHPEVDIQEIWNLTLKSLAADGVLEHADMSRTQLRQLAVEFECRTNPVWPMPHASWCLHSLRASGIQIGLISNAQFFTSELFPALLGATPAALGISSQLQFYSYQYGEAKPGTGLHVAARAALAKMHIQPAQTLCIGNDMINDVVPAAQLGFRTALFAGDERSLRWVYSSEWAHLAPDLVLTDLDQLPPCVASAGHARRGSTPWHNALWGPYAARLQPFG